MQKRFMILSSVMLSLAGSQIWFPNLKISSPVIYTMSTSLPDLTLQKCGKKVELLAFLLRILPSTHAVLTRHGKNSHYTSKHIIFHLW